jgi:hypothetical protein
MALFARDVLTGTLPGPYSDARAEHIARLALIDPDIITAHPRATNAELAALLAVFIEQIAAHRNDRVQPRQNRRGPAEVPGRGR